MSEELELNNDTLNNDTLNNDTLNNDTLDNDAYEEEVEEENIPISSRLWAASGYVWFFCFVPMFLKRDDDFVLAHVRQGVLLFVMWFFFIVISFSPVATRFMGPVGHWAVWITASLGDAFIMVLSLLGIYYSLSGVRWHMPILGTPAKALDAS
ncbi:MAG: hypothetical protein COB53_10850 [Elusimicrobia bacterium]|nr:MAG: hypothetical protein COB53_10850 [Elusimicrobiota bacterium]